MLCLPCGEFDKSGIANLEEAASIARAQGIINVRGAVCPDLLWPLHSLGAALSLGIAPRLPGSTDDSIQYDGVGVHRLTAKETPEPIRELLEKTEKAVIKAVGKELPG